MAGSEQVGLKGADPDLFEGAVWVLTPTSQTDLEAFNRLQSVVSSLGSDVLVLSPADHDRLVAVVSHVPHLVAATLMNAATERSRAGRFAAAAGGRRVPRHDPGGGRASRHLARHLHRERRRPSSPRWTQLLAELSAMRDRVAGNDREAIFDVLQRASGVPAQPAGPHRPARQPVGAAHPGARPARRVGRDHLVGRRRRHQHLRH